MTNDVLRALLAVTVAASAAIALLIASRAVLRRAFGARIAYAAWAAVPVATTAALLPAMRIPAPVRQAMAPLQHAADAGATATLAGGMPWQQWLLAVWLTVALTLVVRLWRDHARYLRQLGPTDGPAVIGLWRPEIIVPENFVTRYSRQEQELILAHESVHLRRRDPLMNALCALIQCALWFHPLVQYAARCFRLDQELSCDAAVMQSHPGRQRSYAEAMLKTQLAPTVAPMRYHWNSIHPLKERIMLLQQTPPSTPRRLLGRAAVAVLVAACAYGAMAANAGAAGAQHYLVRMTLTVGDESLTPALSVREGEPATVVSRGKDGAWRTDLVVSKAGDDTVMVDATIRRNDRLIGTPRLQVRIGESAAVAVDGSYKLQLAVSRQRD